MLYQEIKLKIIMTLYIYGTFLAQFSFCHINTCISITKTQSAVCDSYTKRLIDYERSCDIYVHKDIKILLAIPQSILIIDRNKR